LRAVQIGVEALHKDDVCGFGIDGDRSAAGSLAAMSNETELSW